MVRKFTKTRQNLPLAAAYIKINEKGRVILDTVIQKLGEINWPPIPCIVLIIFICSGFYVYAQGEELTTLGAIMNVSGADANQNIKLARSSADYRVTPGDVYTLAYSAGTTPVIYTITVDTSYRIRVSNLGIINGRDKTFIQLKNEAENVVARNYPLSGVQLVLTQTGTFKVFIKGEVHTGGEVSAWGMSRLSSAAGGNLTGYSSIRDISIKSLNGHTRVYDLFKAQRFGDLNEDPYLQPGDVITINRIKRVITVNGSVERPGAYQLLDGENIKELIEFYANGFTPEADKTGITLTRYADNNEISGVIIQMSEYELIGNYPLKHLDIITIPPLTGW
jgi:protein involved in polysaccharide export with SLBB domain